MPALSLDIRSAGAATVVGLRGEIDLDTMGEVEEALTQLGVTIRDIELDLRGVTFIDSAGITMLLRIHERCRASGGTLVLRSPSAPVGALVELSGVGGYLTILP